MDLGSLEWFLRVLNGVLTGLGGAWDLLSQRAMDCNTVRGVAAPEVLCYCNGLTGGGGWEGFGQGFDGFGRF